MRCILMLLLVLPLCGCTAAPPIGAAETPAVTASPAATTPMPPAPLDESLAMLYLLAASTWQDIYDENYTLSFDVISGTMTEENTALKTKTIYRISVDDGKLFVWAEESGERKQLPFTLEDEVLTIDYGDPLGVITYAVAGKMP